MNTKLIPITFNTPEELGMAILAGRKFEINDGDATLGNSSLGFNGTFFTIDFRDSKTERNANLNLWYKNDQLREAVEVPWYENVDWDNTDGVLCKVWQSDVCAVISLVTDYNTSNGFYGNGMYSVNASPLTKDEVMQYIYKGDK